MAGLTELARQLAGRLLPRGTSQSRRTRNYVFPVDPGSGNSAALIKLPGIPSHILVDPKRFAEGGPKLAESISHEDVHSILRGMDTSSLPPPPTALQEDLASRGYRQTDAVDAFLGNNPRTDEAIAFAFSENDPSRLGLSPEARLAYALSILDAFHKQKRDTRTLESIGRARGILP